MLYENTITKELSPTVSVIVPTLNAEKELPQLLSALLAQDFPIGEILVIDSSSEDKTVEICEAYSKVLVISIPREEFDHGKTRDMAARRSKGEIVVFLTQDAIPADEGFLGKLISPLKNPEVAVSVGRQLPKLDASKMEELVRRFNYPSDSNVRPADDIPRMGIKAFFCSDSCAAYRKDVYIALGGFEYPLKSNEDMLFAAKALQNGYRVAYTADACVYHSHNFSLREQYKRNYLQGYEIERHRSLLNSAPLGKEGMQLVKTVSKGLLKGRHVGALFYFGMDCVARWLGNRNGKAAYRREMRSNVHDR